MKTRKRYTKKRDSIKKGGTVNMFYYASLIKSKKDIDTSKFKTFLDSIENPLMNLYNFDGDGELYTINEYALIHSANVMIQTLFNNYTVNLEHLVQYNSLRTDKLNILEAYILHSTFIINIQYILEQIESTNNYRALFRYFQVGMHIPTILMCAVESSKFKNSMFGNSIYQMVLELYTKSRFYNYLSRDNDNNIVMQLFTFATMFNKSDFMIKIYMFLIQGRPIEEGFNLLFDKDIIANILIHDDPQLYKTAIELMNYTDENLVKEILLDYANQNFNEYEKQVSGDAIVEYLREYKLSGIPQAKIFFEKLGKYTIENIMVPNRDKRIRIIIICHGTIIDDTKKDVSFPFNKLCFFVEKGEKLRNSCIVSRSVEELVCAGNYDKYLQCTESTNGLIEIDNMIFNFENRTLLDKNNKTTGFYICENNTVMKINILGLNRPQYTLEQIINICKDICLQNSIPEDNVNLMLFACRGANVVKVIAPEPILY